MEPYIGDINSKRAPLFFFVVNVRPAAYRIPGMGYRISIFYPITGHVFFPFDNRYQFRPVGIFDTMSSSGCGCR